MEWLLFGIFVMGALLSLANGSNSDSSSSISDNNYGTDSSSWDDFGSYSDDSWSSSSFDNDWDR